MQRLTSAVNKAADVTAIFCIKSFTVCRVKTDEKPINNNFGRKMTAMTLHFQIAWSKIQWLHLTSVAIAQCGILHFVRKSMDIL